MCPAYHTVTRGINDSRSSFHALHSQGAYCTTQNVGWPRNYVRNHSTCVCLYPLFKMKFCVYNRLCTLTLALDSFVQKLNPDWPAKIMALPKLRIWSNVIRLPSGNEQEHVDCILKCKYHSAWRPMFIVYYKILRCPNKTSRTGSTICESSVTHTLYLTLLFYPDYINQTSCLFVKEWPKTTSSRSI